MMSMLCLGNGTSASMLSCIPSILSNSKRANLHFSFGRSFTLPSKVHLRQRALKISTPVICATGRKAALKSLLDVPAFLAKDQVGTPDMRFKLPKKPSMVEVEEIKMHAMKLMKYGKAGEAEKFLENAFEEYRDAPEPNREPALNVEMALVEILICVGKYKEASNRKCLDENQRLSALDSRFPLYKAIIHTMLDEEEEARRYWTEYAEIVEFDPSSH